MNKKYTEVEVWQMLQEATEKLTDAGRKSKPGISALCRHIRISRSHLYSSFPALREKLRDIRQEKQNTDLAQRLREVEEKNAELKRVNAVLAKTCLELKLAILKLNQASRNPKQ